MARFNPRSCQVPFMLIALLAPSVLHAATYNAKLLYQFTAPPGESFGAPADQSGGILHAVAHGQAVGSGDHAIVWAPDGTPTSLRPAAALGFYNSIGFATDGHSQVGYANYYGSPAHAALWTGTSNTFVDLNPANMLNSLSESVYANQQGGWGWGPATNNADHALLWYGSAASAVDLHPANYTLSHVFGNDSLHQVGSAQPADTSSGSYEHAMLWTGTAASVVDLHPPAGYRNSRALDVAGDQQVGYADAQAILWRGSGASAINLHPAKFPAFTISEASATNGIQQVGYAGTNIVGSDTHAMLWSSTPDSAVDLHLLLPDNDGIGWYNSVADSIDADGNIFGTASTQWLVSGNTYYRYVYAVEWSPVPIPEPTTLAFFTGAAFLLRRPGRR